MSDKIKALAAQYEAQEKETMEPVTSKFEAGQTTNYGKILEVLEDEPFAYRVAMDDGNELILSGIEMEIVENNTDDVDEQALAPVISDVAGVKTIGELKAIVAGRQEAMQQITALQLQLHTAGMRESGCNPDIADMLAEKYGDDVETAKKERPSAFLSNASSVTAARLPEGAKIPSRDAGQERKRNPWAGRKPVGMSR